MNHRPETDNSQTDSSKSLAMTPPTDNEKYSQAQAVIDAAFIRQYDRYVARCERQGIKPTRTLEYYLDKAREF